MLEHPVATFGFVTKIRILYHCVKKGVITLDLGVLALSGLVRELEISCCLPIS